MYFNKFPQIGYTFGNGQNIPVVDIFRKVSISQESLNTSNIFTEILNGTGKKPETLAYEYYGSPEYSWLLFLANQTVNPSFDWNIDYETFYSRLNVEYNGDVNYIIKFPKIQEGDIAIVPTLSIQNGQIVITGVETSRYALVTSVNTEFRYFSSIPFQNPLPTGNLIFLRKNEDGKYRPIIDETTGAYGVYFSIKREKYLTAPKYFKYGDLIISPYRIFNPYSSTLIDYTAQFNTNEEFEPEVITDTTTLFHTLLYAHMTDNPLPNGVTRFSFQDFETEQQDLKTKIKIVKPIFIPPLIDLFNKTLNSNSIGRAQKIELTI